MKPLCAAPWNHLHIRSDGKFSFCCHTDRLAYDYPSVVEWWNSPEIRTLRLKMLTTEFPTECRNCFVNKRVTPPYVTHNERVEDLDALAAATAEDGSTTHLPATMLISTHPCNFGCRMCRPLFSSTLESDYKKVGMDVQFTRGTLYEAPDILPDTWMRNVRLLDITGGEPFMSKRYWRLLEQVRMFPLAKVHHTSNLSFPGGTYEKAVAALKGVSCSIQASFDGVGEVGEFIRQGYTDAVFFRNWYALKKDLPHLELGISGTVTSLLLVYLDEYLEKVLEMEAHQGVTTLRIVHSTQDYLNPNCLREDLFKQATQKMRVFGDRYFKKFAQLADLLDRQYQPIALSPMSFDRMTNQNDKDLFYKLVPKEYLALDPLEIDS